MTPPPPSTTARVYHNALVHALATAISAAVGIILTPVLLLTAGRAEYGLWVLSQACSVSSGYMAIFGVGLQSATMRLVAQAPEDDGGAHAASIIGSAARAYAWLGVLAALTLFAFGETIGVRVFRIPAPQVEAARVIFAIAAVQGLVEYLSRAHTAALEGWQRYDLTRTWEIGRLLVFGGLAVILVHAGYGAVGLAAATFAGVLLRSAGVVAVVTRCLPRTAPAARRGTTGAEAALRAKLFRLARPFSIINLIGVVYNVIDRTVISIMVGVPWLADYDVIAKVNTLASIPANVLPAVIPAAGAQLHARGELPALRRLFFQTTRHSLYVSLFATSTLMLLAPQVLNAWVGARFVRLAPFVWIFLSQHLFLSATQVGFAIATGFGAVAPLARFLAFSTGVNLMASVLLTRLLGFPGTLIGTVIGAVVVLPFYLGHLRRVFDMSLLTFARESLLRPYALTAAYAVFCATLIVPAPMSGLSGLAVKGGICGGAFAALVWVLGVDRDERRQAVRWLGGMRRRAFEILGGVA